MSNVVNTKPICAVSICCTTSAQQWVESAQQWVELSVDQHVMLQLINIYTLGNPAGVGVFFPNGLVGNINKPAGFDQMATGLEDFPTSPMDAYQVSNCGQ